MKKKLDFVTNSSSVSFCGWGIIIDTFSDLPDKFKRSIFEVYCSEYEIEKNEENYSEFIEYYDDWENSCEILLTQYNINVISTDYGTIIGVRPNNLPKDKTINDIETELKNVFESYGFENVTVKFIEKIWHD